MYLNGPHNVSVQDVPGLKTARPTYWCRLRIPTSAAMLRRSRLLLWKG